MPKRFQNVLQNFRAGVLSPRYAADVTSEAFAHSLKEGQNFIISSQGGVSYREGMEFVSYNPTQSPFRIFQFRRGGDVSDLLIEVNAGQTRYWLEGEDDTMGLLVDNTTVLVDENSDFLVDENGDFLTLGTVVTENPYTLDELDTLYFTNQATYGILCHENHPPVYTTLNSNNTLISEYFPMERVPEYVYNDYKSPQLAAVTGNWKVSFPSGWSINGIMYYVTYNGVAGDSNFYYYPADSALNATNIAAKLTTAAVKQGYTTAFAVTVIDDLNYTIEVTGENSGFDVTINPVMIYASLPTALPPLVQPADQSGAGVPSDPVSEPAWSYPQYMISDNLYFKCIKPHRSTLDDRPPTGVNYSLYWEDLGAVKPAGYDWQFPDGTGWGEDNVYAPMDRGFPTVPVFHEQRLFLMANKDNPTALYGSALGQYFAFVPGPNDDEAVLFVLDSSDTPEIKWARSQIRLVLGTSSGDWLIDSSNNSTITATDISAQMQNSSRSHLTMPVQIDNEIFYIEQGLRKLRSSSYHRDSGTFISANASLLAEHLVSTTGITRIAQSSTPENMLTMVTSDGRPLWMTYDKNAGLLAFSEGITDGEVIDVCSFFSLNENRDYTYYAINRNGRYVLERMRYPANKAAEKFTQNDIVFMDSWVSGTVEGSTITGLDHLEQKEVYVLIDDAWQVGTYKVMSGMVTLDADYTGQLYAVGLPYTGYMETFEVADNVRGTGLGTKRRWNRLTTRVLNSSLPVVYDERASDRRPSIPMGESDNVRAGLHDITQNVTGYTYGGINITQDRPYPLYITAFFGQYQVEDD